MHTPGYGPATFELLGESLSPRPQSQPIINFCDNNETIFIIGYTLKKKLRRKDLKAETRNLSSEAEVPEFKICYYQWFRAVFSLAEGFTIETDHANNRFSLLFC